MNLFSKSYEKFIDYQSRDLIYKCNLNNLYEIPNIANGVALQKKDLKEEIYPYLSSFIILFDKKPFILQINKSSDKKIQGTVIGTKLFLNKFDLYSFVYRLKTEEGYLNLKKQLLGSSYIKNTLFFKLNIFDEFLTLYDRFSMLQELSVSFNFVNCKNKEEKFLLLSNLIAA